MSNILTKQVAALVFCLSLSFPSLVTAADDEYVCEARQSSKNELPVLSQECPLGNGIWGTEPEFEDGLFWIQCGLFVDALTVKEAQPIYKVISTDVWAKKEKKNYRCLIGPYEKYSVAKSDLKKVKTLDLYKESFIRNATAGSSAPVAAISKPKAKPTPVKTPAKAKKKPVAPAVSAAAVLAPVVDNPAKPTAMPKPVTMPKETKAVVEPKITKASVAEPSETVVARRDVKIGDKYYVIPFLMDGYDQFYMEYGIAWNRLNYDRATEVCNSQNMRLPSTDEWQLLIDSQVMRTKQWPLHLPYWGDGKRGLFTSGKVTQLTGSSLLNVVCVK